MMKNVAAIILGGGQGKRLFPLTTFRCKPAMYYGGRHRLIDIPISNAIHSGCRSIFVITQFLSRSLHQHISATYPMSSFSSSHIQILTVEERPNEKNWLQGTADAIRQNLDYLQESTADYFLILSGDQLYSMDYNHMMEVAKSTEADIVIAALPVQKAATTHLGIFQINSKGIITTFVEKPTTQVQLKSLRLTKTQEKKLGLADQVEGNYLGSMGIYLFKRKTLIDVLKSDHREDFGKHIIPAKLKEGKVAVYMHQGYWEDVGTIASFYQANMSLTSRAPPFDCYRLDRSFFAYPTTLPGARLIGSTVDHSIVCEGTVVEDSTIRHSIIGPSTRIGKGTTIQSSYLMGNEGISSLVKKYQIGENCLINKAIIDKNVTIGNGVKLINRDQLVHYDSEHVYIRDGIIVVPRGATIPDNFIL